MVVSISGASGSFTHLFIKIRKFNEHYTGLGLEALITYYMYLNFNGEANQGRLLSLIYWYTNWQTHNIPPMKKKLY